MLCFKRLCLFINNPPKFRSKDPHRLFTTHVCWLFHTPTVSFYWNCHCRNAATTMLFIKNVQELQPQVWKITLQSLGAKKRLCVLALVCDLSCHSGFIGPKCEMKEYNVLYVVPGSGKLRYVLIASIIGALQVAIISVVVLCITRWVITWKEVCICDFLVGFIGPKITFSIIFALTYKKNRDKLF